MKNKAHSTSNKQGCYEVKAGYGGAQVTELLHARTTQAPQLALHLGLLLGKGPDLQ